MDRFLDWILSSPLLQWFAKWLGSLMSYYGCPNSKRAEKLQMKRRFYR